MKNRKLAQGLSTLFMGLGQLYSGFYLKGLVLIIVEIATIIYVKGLLISAHGLYTLGTKTAVLDGFDYTPGDNSLTMLCNGTIAVLILSFIIIIYFVNIIDAGKCIDYVEEKEEHPGFFSYVKEFYNKRFVAIMLIPAAVGILTFIIIPMVLTVMVAFTNYSAPNHLPPKNLFTWVGISNFYKLAKMKAWSSTFVGVGIWTLTFAVCATFLNYFGGLFLAMLVNKHDIRLKGLWRSIFILPYAVPAFVSLLVFRLMLDASGPVNTLIGTKLPFFTDPLMAKVMVLVINTWLGAPYFMILLSGALTNIPSSLYEAAQIDGANKIQQFFKITLPMLLFQTAPVMIMTFAYNFNNFGAIYFLTDGLPSNSSYRYAGSTDNLLTWVYKMTKEQSQFSSAAVISIFIFFFVALISLIFFMKSKSFKEEGMV
jgi:arabinogalactan oligomer / maltooligosaccharide transport system permease protein